MYFTPESRVSHAEHGAGTIIHATLVNVASDNTSSSAYVVQFDDGGMVTFSEAAGVAELLKLRGNSLHCPFCHENLQGKEIPEESQHSYGATHFSRAISMEIRHRWYALPLVLLWALPSRLLHDRKRHRRSKALREYLDALKLKGGSAS